MSGRGPRRGQGPKRSRWQWLRDAFSVESDHGPLTEREIALLDRIATFLVRKRMTTPAVIFLESVKPMNYLGSQAMAFFEPIVRTLFAGEEYMELQRILERRESIEALIQRIELAESGRNAPAPEAKDVREEDDPPDEESDQNEVHQSR